MANIHEITYQVLQRRGAVKAAIIKADVIEKTVKVNHDARRVQFLLDDLKRLDSDSFTGTIWFQSGSYAYIDKDGAGYYWSYIAVPEIPKELR
jgi:hypothetical protein